MATNRLIISDATARFLGKDTSRAVRLSDGNWDFGESEYDPDAFRFQGESPGSSVYQPQIPSGVLPVIGQTPNPALVKPDGNSAPPPGGPPGTTTNPYGRYPPPPRTPPPGTPPPPDPGPQGLPPNPAVNTNTVNNTSGIQRGNPLVNTTSGGLSNVPQGKRDVTSGNPLLGVNAGISKGGNTSLAQASNVAQQQARAKAAADAQNAPETDDPLPALAGSGTPGQPTRVNFEPPVSYQAYLKSLEGRSGGSEAGSSNPLDYALSEEQWNALDLKGKLKNMDTGGLILKPGDPDYERYASLTGAEPGRNIIVLGGAPYTDHKGVTNLWVNPNQVISGDGWFAFSENNMTPEHQAAGDGLEDWQWIALAASIFGGAMLVGGGLAGGIGAEGLLTAEPGLGFGTAGQAGAASVFSPGASGALATGALPTGAGPSGPPTGDPAAPGLDIPGPMDPLPPPPDLNPMLPGVDLGGGASIPAWARRIGTSLGTSALRGLLGGGNNPTGRGPGMGLGNLINSGININQDNRNRQWFDGRVDELLTRGDFYRDHRGAAIDRYNNFLMNPEAALNDPTFKAVRERNLENLSRQYNARGMALSGNEMGALTAYGQELDWKQIEREREELRKAMNLGDPTGMARAGIDAAGRSMQNRQTNAFNRGQFGNELLNTIVGGRSMAEWLEGVARGIFSRDDLPRSVFEWMQEYGPWGAGNTIPGWEGLPGDGEGNPWDPFFQDNGEGAPGGDDGWGWIDDIFGN